MSGHLCSVEDMFAWAVRCLLLILQKLSEHRQTRNLDEERSYEKNTMLLRPIYCSKIEAGDREALF